MSKELSGAIIELKTEIKYIGRTLEKVEKVLENQALLLEKQSVANNRIKDLERDGRTFEKRVRILEDWKIKIIGLVSFISTGLSTAAGLIINLLTK